MRDNNDIPPTLEAGDRLDRLEALALSGRVDRRGFIRQATALGLGLAAASLKVDQAFAIADNQKALREALRTHYDYIVCGAGSSGSVVARRLAEDPQVRVLLLEAGGTDDAPSILNPAVWYTNIGGPFDWGYKVQPSPSINNRTILSPMGKALGGGSSINAMIWARGHKNDFEMWAREAGDPAWGYAHALEIYKRIEDWQGAPDPARRGKGGLLYVQPAPNPSPLAPAMVEAASSIGIPGVADHNGAIMEGDGGCAIANMRLRDNRRLNVPTDYLHPIMNQPNITVLTRALVHRLVMDGKRARGVEFEWDGQVRKIMVDREVILSTGAIHTPKILMLSGIGDQAELTRLGIATVMHLPGVGQNFQDHTMIGGCMWEAREPLPARNNSAEATFFWKSDPSLDTPDLQPFQIEVPYTSEVFSKQAVPGGWVINPGIVRPKSRGFLRLTSADPRALVEIHANTLQHPDDVKALRKGVELCRELGNSAAMKPFVKREVLPGPIKGEALDEFIRNGAVSYFHQTCTAKMGRDSMSVVDASLKVYGIEGLRIADGSIMPQVSTGNTMAPCVLIGERMAEILKA